MKSEKSSPQDARTIALKILNALSDEYLTLDRAFEISIKKNQVISGKDRALLNTLVYGVLRWRNRLDYVIRHFSKIKFSKIDPIVLNILRLGLYQIIYLSRIPVSAAVNTSVEISKKNNPPWTVKFVNALLRKASRDYQTIPYPIIEKNPIQAIAVNQSFPEWLIKKWIHQHGIDETLLMCKAFNKISPLTIRTNILKISREKLLKNLESASEKADITHLSPCGIIAKKIKQPVSNLSYFKSGWFQVQDEAAQLVSYFTGVKPGEYILDACAGLGGKTGHLAQIMENKGKILAVDHNDHKLSELDSQMKRLGIQIVDSTRINLLKPKNQNKLGSFHRILLDAPCSGLGVIGRNPDIKWKSFKQDLKQYKKNQVKFLLNLSSLLKPGGLIVYVVCSLEPEENEEVVKEFLNECSAFSVDKGTGKLPKQALSLIDKNGYFKTSPWTYPMDGFFAVRFRKNRSTS